MSKKYVLYGTGLEGERFLYCHAYMKEEIEYCIDAFHSGHFHGLPIVKIEAAKSLEKYKVIVAAIGETYLKIKKGLEALGLVEFENFIWASIIGRKLMLINANCHGEGLLQYLMNIEVFKEKYTVYPLAPIHWNKSKKISRHLLENVDVYIHQDIRAENKIGYELSDEFIIPKLKKDCLNITIPNFVGMSHWMFPMQGDYGRTITTPGRDLGVLFEDSVLEEARSKGLTSLDEYEEFYLNYHFKESFMQELFDKDIKKIKERNSKWDVKILDYILDNYKTIPCFIDKDHPSKHVFAEIGKQVAKLLGLLEWRDFSYAPMLGISSPVLPCVKEYFGMDFHVPSEPVRCRLEDKNELGIRGYIRCYIWWFYECFLQ